MLTIDVVQPRIRPIHSDHSPTHSTRSHQALHAPPAHSDALFRELPMHPRAPVCPVARFEDLTDRLPYDPVLFPMRARRAGFPCVVARPRHSE